MEAVNGRRLLMINMDRNYLDMVARASNKIADEWEPATDDMDIDEWSPVIIMDNQKKQKEKPTDEAIAKYIEKNKDTEGFDVDEFKSFLGVAYPVDDFKEQPLFFKDANTLSQMAINMYNKYHGTSYRFIKVLRLYTQPVAGFNHYITFLALDENKLPSVGETTFQALGSRLIPNETWPDGLTVEYCRVKGT